MNALLVMICGAVVIGAEQADGGARPDTRVAWTTSKIAGSPESPPPYKVEMAFPHLKFSSPTVLSNAPGTNRLFVTEQRGKILSFPNDANASQPDLVIDLSEARPQLEAIYGLTFHPNFATNRTAYVCYVVNIENKDEATRVSRFQFSDSDPPQLDPESEEILITWLSGGHNGGCLKFGPDGYLYISTGDAGPASPPDPERVGQDVSNLLSSLLRIDVDRRDNDRPYSIPADNPFVDLSGARPEIWSFGFRNPWKFSFDRLTGDLWVGDVGWELWEMIYRVQRGGNYGWSVKEGRQSVHLEETIGPTPILPPILDHPHSEAASITGGFVYRGTRLPELTGAYIYGDFQSGIVWGASFDGDKLLWKRELARTPLQLVGFGEDHAGEVYLLDYRQQIFRLIENQEPDNSDSFPRLLSETGLFDSVGSQSPAAGVLPYSINAEQWLDGAQTERWLAIPGGEPISIVDGGYWRFPDGAVAAKTINVETDAGKQRVETQILHREAGSWRPYSYIWDDSQTEATLAPAAGVDRTLRVPDSRSSTGFRERSYRISSRTECVLCHNPWVEKKTTVFGVQSASPLALSTQQLNRDHGHFGLIANQLETFQHIGWATNSGVVTTKEQPRFADPHDGSADLNARARAYLHVNCAHCPQFNAGGAATIVLSHSAKLDETKTVGVRPTQGAFGIADASIVSAGDPFGSVLLYRMAKLGGGRMPRVGSHEVDKRAVSLIHDWIKEMEGSSSHSINQEIEAAIGEIRSTSSTEATRAALETLTSSTRGALRLLHLLEAGGVGDSVRSEIVRYAGRHEAAEVRDLFETFIPVAERIQRLGTAVDPQEILELAADAERGKRVFFDNSAAACKTCHRIQGLGEVLGPDLSEIGKKYEADQLLTHILEPSKFMEPKYVPYLLETAEGKVLSGLLESQSNEEVVLRDAQNKSHRVPAEDVELLVRQQKSIMPELLLRDLTRNEVADLLAYLMSLTEAP